MFLRRCASLLCTALLLAACATTGEQRSGASNDPLEPLNRSVLSFNEGLDEYLMKPIAEGYQFIMPTPARVGVSNFLANLNDLWIGANNLLQGKPESAASDIGRLVVNSTVGILGFFDVASEIGLDKHAEDFGQTLGKWGVPAGPYIEIPVLGPSTLRDGFGLFVDFKADPIIYATENQATRNALVILSFINARQQVLGVETTLDQAAFDKYIFRRDFFLRKREADINDGRRAPREDDFE